MREKRNFAERTKVLKSDQVKKKYFLVFEGKDTERIYFEAVDEYRNVIGINPLIELVPILRSYSEEGWSNPKKILDRILENIAENQSGQISYETLLNWVMDYFYEEGILKSSKVEAANMWATLILICEERIDAKISDVVDDIEKRCAQIADYFSTENNLNTLADDVPKIIENRAITYDDAIDKICFVIDRDRESFVSKPENDQYGDMLKICREKNFGFYLSNPCFEFWLLLHFDEVNSLDLDFLLSNPKVTAKRRYTEQELRKLMPGFTKSKYNVNILIPRIENAIANEKKFCEDDAELEYTVGSKVGLLLEELRK